MTDTNYRTHSIPVDILDELAVRFILHIPPEEKDNMVRVCFQIEQAHWFYQDFYVNKMPHLKLQNGTMKEFATHIFGHVEFLQSNVDRVEEIVDEWREYKLSVPTFGAIILNPGLDKVLLVQGFWAKASWGFPKGKVNEDEPPDLCAAREVMEETGFDISSRLDPEEYLEQIINDQTVRLYLIQGVDETTVFQTNTRCEIKDIKWFHLDSLPTCKTDLSCKNKLGIGPNNFFMVIPFLREIKAWVKLVSKDRCSSIQSNFNPNTDSCKKRNRSRRTESETDTPCLRQTPIDPPSVIGKDVRCGKGCVETDTGIRRPVAKKPEKKLSVERTRDKVSPGKAFPVDTKSRKKLFKEESRNRAEDNRGSPVKPVASDVDRTLSGSVSSGVPPPSSKTKYMSGTGRDSVPGSSLLPPNFCPRAWSGFTLNHRELMEAATMAVNR